MADDHPTSIRQSVGETNGAREDQLQRALEHVRTALASLRFGQILITVQDGVVVQIDRTEKTRLR